MITIGVDESGTGAWAGPITVCAFALDDARLKDLTEIGVKDSKQLSDKKRRALCDRLNSVGSATCVKGIPVSEIKNLGQASAWVKGCAFVIRDVWYQLREQGILTRDMRLVIDGSFNQKLSDRLLKPDFAGLLAPEFLVNADESVPAVSAASILAKTHRNDRMLELDALYPNYLWRKNYGYGTVEHRKAIDDFGVTEEHRSIKRTDRPKGMFVDVNVLALFGED